MEAFHPLCPQYSSTLPVFPSRFGAIQPNSMKVDDLYKVALMLLDRALEDNSQVTLIVPQEFYLIEFLEQAAVQGIVVIYDIDGVTTSHTLMMTPAIMKKHVVVFQVGAIAYGGLKSLNVFT